MTSTNRNRYRSLQPTARMPQDEAHYAAMRERIARAEKATAARQARERIARLACIAMTIFLMVTMFYACTN